MNWLIVIVQWLHVLLAIVWFGYAIAMFLFIKPVVDKLPEESQRDLNFRFGERTARAMPFIALGVLILGIVRGTVFGQVNSFNALTTAYGITFLVALLGTLALIFNGARNMGPAFSALRTTPDFAGTAVRLQRYAQFDLVLFTVVFSCMILMRFGL